MLSAELLLQYLHMEVPEVPINKWIKIWYRYTMAYYSATRLEWSFARCTTQMDLEGFRLSDIKSDGERHTVWYNWYVGSEKYNELVNKKKKQENTYGQAAANRSA